MQILLYVDYTVIVCFVTFLILLFGVPIFYGLARDETPTFAPYKGLIEFLGQKTTK